MPAAPDSPPLLTAELLGEYERRVEEQGFPIERARAPGLGEKEMAAMVKALPLELSLEATTWWRWHNGSLPDENGRHWPIAPGRHLVSLEAAVAAYSENRMLAEERAEETGPDVWWDPQWIPILQPDNGTTIGCDCSVAAARPSPLFVVWWMLPDYEQPQRAAGSLGQMIEWWIDALDRGIWRYDRQAASWRRAYRAVPRGREGLV